MSVIVKKKVWKRFVAGVMPRANSPWYSTVLFRTRPTPQHAGSTSRYGANRQGLCRNARAAMTTNNELVNNNTGVEDAEEGRERVRVSPKMRTQTPVSPGTLISCVCPEAALP